MSSDKVNILIVDDLPEKLLVLKTVLEELDENIVSARSGEEALRRVLDQDFAVILLDVNMPGMDGLETAALIRRRKKSAHTPVIFVTAFADEIHTTRGYSLGAVDYILSPINPDILRSKVRVFVDLFRMTQEVRRQADERVTLARELAARVAAEEATGRSAFLAEASKVLAHSLDYEATLRSLLRLAVPYLGDVSAATLVDEHGNLRPTELAWHDGAGEPRAGTVPSLEALHPEWRKAVERALESAKREELTELSPLPQAGTTATADRDGSQDLLVPSFDMKSLVVVPLLARGRALGALSLAMGSSGRRYTAADLTLADDLAGRAAIAIDNARLYRDVQQADRHKNEFLSMLAHELRNPLAPIRNAVQIMRMRGDDRPELQLARDMIDRQVQHLVRLVDDLLDISRITRGKIRLQTEAMDVATAVARAVETSRPLIDSRRHDLFVELPPETVRVEADPVRLAQILGNLLNNAAKYTEEGGRIWLTLMREGNEAVIRIRDTGVGIPPELLSSIFDLFTQAERSLDRSQGGLGIGLTLVRRLVELHHGRVHASSPGPGQGSEFVVRLPALPEDHSLSALVNGAEGQIVRFRRCRILVVDDNVDAAGSLGLVLRMAGHAVHVCHDGPTALEAVEAFRPDVVLLDISLPRMNGYEVARRLRDQVYGKDLLLVALTGYGQEEDVNRSREAGFNHHLMKPADPLVLNALFASLGAGRGAVQGSAK